MPNWVTINVHVTGDEKALEEFANAHFVPNNDPNKPVWETDVNFDFNTIIPRPACLVGTVSGSGFTEKQLAANASAKEACGYDNWYDWSLDNWDTKWNASDTHVGYEHAGDMEFSINTAWSLPRKIFEELSELYPELIFNIDCVEEGGFFSGQLAFEAGVEVLDNITDDEESWKEAASRLNGYEFDEDEE